MGSLLLSADMVVVSKDSSWSWTAMGKWPKVSFHNRLWVQPVSTRKFILTKPAGLGAYIHGWPLPLYYCCMQLMCHPYAWLAAFVWDDLTIHKHQWLLLPVAVLPWYLLFLLFNLLNPLRIRLLWCIYPGSGRWLTFRWFIPLPVGKHSFLVGYTCLFGRYCLLDQALLPAGVPLRSGLTIWSACALRPGAATVQTETPSDCTWVPGRYWLLDKVSFLGLLSGGNYCSDQICFPSGQRIGCYILIFIYHIHVLWAWFCPASRSQQFHLQPQDKSCERWTKVNMEIAGMASKWQKKQEWRESISGSIEEMIVYHGNTNWRLRWWIMMMMRVQYAFIRQKFGYIMCVTILWRGCYGYRWSAFYWLSKTFMVQIVRAYLYWTLKYTFCMETNSSSNKIRNKTFYCVIKLLLF